MTSVPIKTLKAYADKGEIRCKRNPKNNYRMFKLMEVIEDLKKLNIIAS